MSLLKHRKPEKLKRQAVASRKSDKEPDLSASSTIAPSISIDTGSFLVTNLASEHCKPSKVALEKGSAIGDVKPALKWTHDTAFAASSTAAHDLDLSTKCCRYKTNWWGLAGRGCSLYEEDHVFHLLYAHKYLATVLSARLRKIVFGSLPANSFSSG